MRKSINLIGFFLIAVKKKFLYHYSMKELKIHILSLTEIRKKRDFLLQTLDEERKKKSLSFQEETHQLQSLGAGYFISKYTQKDKELTYNEYGKPYKEGCFFNLAHSEEYVVFLSDERECGIDIEKIQNMRNRVLDYAFNEEDRKMISSPRDFYFGWTGKEALGKALGCGLCVSSLKEIPCKKGNLTYNGMDFYLESFSYRDYAISFCLQGKEEREYQIVEERIEE